MVAPTATEQFINWITGKPMALFDALGSVFNKAPNNTIGLVPDPGNTPGITKFLREDATWDVPPGTAANFIAAGATHAAGLVPDPGASIHDPPYFLMDDATFRNFVSQGNNLINGIIVESHSGNAVTIAIKTLSGSDPSSTDTVFIVFRNSTAGTGNYTILSITSAFSITVSSGSTLGASNNTAFKIWLVCFNDSGTTRLGVINCNNNLDIYPLNAWQIANSTAEGGAGAADSAAVFYTGSEVASKSYSILGYLSWENGLATAGTWITPPTRIQIKNDNVPNPGDTIQSVQHKTAAVTTGATAIPVDNTIPQNTEGNQYLTKSITPSSATNVLKIYGIINLATNTSILSMAIFQDSTADAIYANGVPINALNTMMACPFLHKMLAATSISTTFNVRAGQSTANTTTFNGAAGAGIFGGVQYSYLIINELMT